MFHYSKYFQLWQNRFGNPIVELNENRRQEAGGFKFARYKEIKPVWLDYRYSVPQGHRL